MCDKSTVMFSKSPYLSDTNRDTYVKKNDVFKKIAWLWTILDTFEHVKL